MNATSDAPAQPSAAATAYLLCQIRWTLQAGAPRPADAARRSAGKSANGQIAGARWRLHQPPAMTRAEDVLCLAQEDTSPRVSARVWRLRFSSATPSLRFELTDL